MTVIFSLCTDIEIDDDHVRVILNCGHSYKTVPHYNEISIEDYYERIAHMKGYKQRCSDCEAAQDTIDRQKL